MQCHNLRNNVCEVLDICSYSVLSLSSTVIWSLLVLSRIFFKSGKSLLQSLLLFFLHIFNSNQLSKNTITASLLNEVVYSLIREFKKSMGSGNGMLADFHSARLDQLTLCLFLYGNHYMHIISRLRIGMCKCKI